MTDATQQIGGFDPGRVLRNQVAAWTKERDRLQELIDTASLAATPSPVPAEQPNLLSRLTEIQEIVREGMRWDGNEHVFAPKSESEVTQIDDILSDALRLADRPAPAEPEWTGDDSEALIHLSPNFTDTAGLLRPKAGYVPTQKDYSALTYLCNEWDYGYDPSPSQPDQSAQEVVDLSKLKHADNCRYWEDSEFCTCGADTYEQLQKARARIAELEAPAAPSAAQAAGVNWERVAKAQDAKLRAMCNEQGGMDRLREVLREAKALEFATTPSEGVAAPVEPAVVGAGEMTTERAAFFMRRFKGEEKLLGPNEQKAVAYVLALLESQAAAAPAQPSADQVRDAARWRYSMEYRELARTGQPQPDPILAMWIKVYDEYRLHPTREEYEAAIDEAMRASGEKGADRG